MDFRKYSNVDINALSEKERNPNKIVLCPRCGKELIYKSVGNSYEIKCKTESCLKRTV